MSWSMSEFRGTCAIRNRDDQSQPSVGVSMIVQNVFNLDAERRTYFVGCRSVAVSISMSRETSLSFQ